MLRFVCFLLLSSLASVTTAADNGDSLAVDAVLCRSVEEREPVGQDTVFLSDVERVYCWTLVTGATEPTTVTHVWSFGEREMASVELQVKSAWFRTWSYKTILPQWTGDWHTEVYDEERNLLEKVDFKVLAGETE